MSAPLARVRLRFGFATLALVSLLHTSVTSHAQAPPPAGSQQKRAGDQKAPAPTSAPAADPAGSVRERARTAYGAGRDAYAAEQYAEAEAQFALADSLLPSIQAKYWRAMSLDKVGNVPAAYEAFGVVIASPDKEQLGAEKLAGAEARHKQLAATPAETTITTIPSGARINVSGVDLPGPAPQKLRLAPGRHVVSVSLEGYQPQQIEIIATPGAKLSPTLTLIAAPTPPLPPPGMSAPPAPALAPSTQAERSRVPGYVTLGIAAASAAVGTVFGIRALGAKDDFEKDPTTAHADDVERNALIADMAFGVTLTLGITGIVLLVADDPAPEQASAAPPERGRLSLVPYIAPKSAGAAATLTF